MKKVKSQLTLWKSRRWFAKLYSNKLASFEEIYRYLHTYKLRQEGINRCNNSITSNEIDTVINNLPTKKSPGPDRFTAEFHKNL